MKINQILFFPVVKIDSNYNLPSGKSVNYVKNRLRKKICKAPKLALQKWDTNKIAVTKLSLL